VEYPFFSDHAPVLLQLDSSHSPSTHPFKFNSSWLTEASFNNIVLEVWSDPIYNTISDPQHRLVSKLKALKAKSKLWARNQKIQKQTRIIELERAIQSSLLEDPPTGASCDSPNTLHLLESERNTLLLAEEARWRLHSRATWIKGGDLNTKFFHQYASFRQNKKHIWGLQDDEGLTHRGQTTLLSTATTHFKNFYAASTHPQLRDSVTVANTYTRFVTAADSSALDCPSSLQEVKVALASFNKDRSPGPDGWTVEFFLHHFDLVGPDLLELVEDSRLHGKIIGALNSTFITLIPKENNPSTFGDYRPISLCNLCYKLVTKIIANRLKPILSRALSEEQLGFLKGRQILDTIGTTHECLHSIKVKKIQSHHPKIRPEKGI
jgi:hypothetical protein